MTAPLSTTTQGTFTPMTNPPVQGTFTPFTKAEAAQTLTTVDSTTGAPIGLRAAVGAAATPAQQLATIRQWQSAHGITPDAKPTQDGNFVYSANGGPMILFRPTGPVSAKGLLGWEAEHLSNVAEMGGQILGQTTGMAAGMAAGGPAGAVAGGMGLGGLDAAAAKNVARTALGSIFGTAPDQRSFGQQAGEAAATAGANALGAGAGMATGAAMGALGRAMTPAAQVPTTTGLAQTGQRLQNFSDLGIPPTWGMASQQPFLQQVEAALTADPLTRPRMLGAYANAALGGQNAANSLTAALAGDPLTGKLAAQSGTAAGLLKQSMVEGSTAAIKAFDNSLTQMEGIMEDMTRQAPPVVPVNTEKYFQSLLTSDPNLPNTMPFGKDPGAQRVMNVLQDARQQGGLTFGQLQTLRTTTDGLIDKAGGFAGTMDYDGKAIDNLKGLRANLKNDLYNAAQTIDQQNGFQPNPVQPLGPVSQALADHDAFVSGWHDSNKELSFKTFQEMRDTYGALDPAALQTAGPKDLGRTYVQLRQHFPPDQYNALASVWFANLGRSTDGVADTWDPTRFVQQWKAAEPWRHNMLAGTTAGQTADGINKLVTAADNMSAVMPKSGSQPSIFMRTVAPLIGGAIGGGAEHLFSGGGLPASGVATALGAIGLPYLAARTVTSPLAANTAQALLTSPAFVKAILPLASMTGEAVGKTATMSLPMASRILAVGYAEPRLKSAIQDYFQTLQQDGVNVPTTDTFTQMSRPGVSFQPRP